MTTDLQALRDAIAAFDAGKAERDRLWAIAESNDDIEAACAARQKALDAVREEFWELTKDRNSRKNCMIVDLEFMRRIAARDFI